MATRDYARQQRRPAPPPERPSGNKRKPANKGKGKVVAQRPLPLWVWMVLALSVLVLGFALYSVSRPVAPLAMAPSSEAKAAKNAPKVIEIPPKQPSRFDFYEMLPSYEVVVPDEVINPTKTKPVPKPAVVAAAAVPTHAVADPAAILSATAPSTASIEKPAEKPAAAPATAKPKPALAAVTETHERVSKPVAHTADPVPPQPTATLAQGEHFLVQVAAYRTRDDAEQKRAALAISGVSAHVESVSLPNGETWHRVRLGPFQSAAAAAAAQGNLRDQGFNGVVMKVKS